MTKERLLPFENKGYTAFLVNVHETSTGVRYDMNLIGEFCKRNGLKLFTYTAEELMSANGDFQKSDFVLAQTGTDNVCERSAVMTGGRLIMPKRAANGVTVAAAELPTEIDFEKRIL